MGQQGASWWGHVSNMGEETNKQTKKKSPVRSSVSVSVDFFCVIIQEGYESIQLQDAANYNQSLAGSCWAQLGLTIVFC